MNFPDYKFCGEVLKKYGFDGGLSEESYEKFAIYAKFLVEYNKKVNLTAITEPDEIFVKHFLDSIFLLKYVEIPSGSSIIDVGTGAGFPSVPLKIVRPDIKITLLDSLNKRVDFLRQLCERLDIDAEFVHARAEEVGQNADYRERFDFACARAVSAMNILSEFCIPLVRVGGSFIALKGHSEDIYASENSVKILGGEIENLYEYSLAGNKKLVCVKKISHTPPKYPRNSGQIKKKPL